MTRRLVLVAVAAGLLAFAVVPLGLVLAEGLGSFGAMAEAGPLLNTVLLAVGTAAFAVPLGATLGVLWARHRLPRVWVVGLLLPYAVPPYVTTIAWIAIANPTTGWVGLDLYSLGGMIWVLGVHLAPIVAVGVRDAVRRIDPSLEEAARVSGASPARVLREVTLPLVRPALLAGGGFVAAAATASFGVPYLLSSSATRPTPVLSTRIATWLDLGTPDARAHAAALALLLLAVGLAFPTAARLLLGGRQFASNRVGRPPAPTRSRAATAFVIGWVLVSAVLPLLTVASLSVRASAGAGLVPDNLTLARWAALAADVRTRDALLRSLALAAGAATVTVAVGAVVGHAAERAGSRGIRALAAVARAPYAVPGTVLALGLLLVWSREVRLVFADRITVVVALGDTMWLLGTAYAVKLLALPVDATRAAVRSLHPSLEEAARTSGATWTRTWRDVTLPLLDPALRGAWFLVFAAAFCEVTLSVLLRGPTTDVLGTRLFYLQTYADTGAAAVLATLVAGVVTGGLLAGGTRGWAS